MPKYRTKKTFPGVRQQQRMFQRACRQDSLQSTNHHDYQNQQEIAEQACTLLFLCTKICLYIYSISYCNTF